MGTVIDVVFLVVAGCTLVKSLVNRKSNKNTQIVTIKKWKGGDFNV